MKDRAKELGNEGHRLPSARKPYHRPRMRSGKAFERRALACAKVCQEAECNPEEGIAFPDS